MTAPRDVLYGDAPSPTVSRRGPLLIAFVVFVVGFFNAGKPVHIDDALYLAISRQILKDPFDPYGFSINWQHVEQPAYQVSISPPLLSYYHAFWMRMGAGEAVLHLAMIPWLALLGWSVAALLSRAGPNESLGAVIVLVCPAVFAGTNLMLDVPMTACLTAGVEWLLRGLDRGSWWSLGCSGLAAGAAVLIKYPAMVFIGLCVALTLIRRDWRPLIPSIFCGAAFLGWQWWSSSLYGAGQVQQATSFLERFHGEGGRKTLERLLQLFVLLGGAFPVWVVSAIHGRSRGSGLVFAVVCLLVGRHFLVSSGAWRGEPAQVYSFLAFLFLGSFGVGELVVSACRVNVPGAWLQLIALLWFVGIAAVTTISAPFVAVRYLLPALPALLLVQTSTLRPTRTTLGFTAALTGVIGLATAVADLRWANFYPRKVAGIRANHAHRTVFFCGHWGLQWYGEQAGMTPWDARWTDAPADSIIVVPQRADPTPIHPLVRARMELVREYVQPRARFGFAVWAPTRKDRVGICFYGWEFPHLPWGFRPEPAETIGLFEVR